MQFSDFNINSPLLNALSDLNITTPTTIQEKAFPVIMSGRDVVGIAQTGTGNVFDFNRIIPMPSELNIDCKSIGEISLMHMLSECLDDYKFLIDKDIITKYWGEISDNDRVESIELGKKYLINIAKYGYPNCYGWRKKNWGCKWNAMDCNVEGNTITFSTPWCY